MSDVQHTPEPCPDDGLTSITLSEDHGPVRVNIADNDGGTIAEMVWHQYEGHHDRAKAKLYACRIVACVNACAGIPTLMIERAGHGAVLTIGVSTLTTQRDEARAMVAELVEKVQWLIEAIESEGKGGTEEDRAMLTKGQTFLAAIHA